MEKKSQRKAQKGARTTRKEKNERKKMGDATLCANYIKEIKTDGNSKEKEKENNIELEEWNRLRRIEKVRKLQKKWLEKKDEKKPTISTHPPLLQEQENAALVGARDEQCHPVPAEPNSPQETAVQGKAQVIPESDWQNWRSNKKPKLSGNYEGFDKTPRNLDTLDTVQPKITAYLKPAKIPPPPMKENNYFDSSPCPEEKCPPKKESKGDPPSKNDVILEQSSESSALLLHEEIVDPPLRKDIQEVVKTETKRKPITILRPPTRKYNPIQNNTQNYFRVVT